jgi:hypothetical protein
MQQLRDQVTSSSPAATDTMLTAALEEERRQRLALAEQVTSLQQEVASLMVRLDARTPTADVLQAPQQATNAHADGCVAGQALVVRAIAGAPALEPMKPAIDPEQREALVDECDAVIAQFAHVPALKDAIQQRDELQKEFSALKSSKIDYKTSVQVGRSLKAAKEAVAQQPLSEENYVTLTDRLDEDNVR